MPQTTCPLRTIALIFRHALSPLVATLFAIVSLGCATQSATPRAASVASSREDIYVLRSLREERSRKSDWCTPTRTGFEPPSGVVPLEDRYTMWAVAVQSSDGRITDSKANVAGELHACFGSTTDPKVISFFTEGRIAGVSFSGSGNCLVGQPDFPEKGITTFRCYLDLRGLPAPYVGGLLTTNTVGSKAVLGDVTDPPGYVQPSIATIRLWRSQ